MNQVRIDVVFLKLAVGIHFGSVDKWLLQCEIFFDTSPFDSEDHTPDMPIDRQIRYATEVQYNWSDRLRLVRSLFMPSMVKSKIDNDLIKGYINEMTFFLS
jgi:long-chain fatty acid transport protein